MKTDITLQQEVRDELSWDPALNTSDIDVTAKDGIITLSGYVNSYSKKLAAESAAKRVKDVTGVAIALKVYLAAEDKRTDEEITSAAWNAIKWSSFTPDDCIRIKVDKGWITLEGEVKWQSQKESAFAAVRNLVGIYGVSNLIKVRAGITPIIIKDVVKKALTRNAEIEADRINIVTDGGRIVISGKVRSWAEKTEVHRAVWATPGVVDVRDELVIE